MTIMGVPYNRKNSLRVAIGPVFDPFGGVSQHIFGIKKRSSHNVMEVPSETTRRILNCIRLGTRLRRELYCDLMNEIGLNRYEVLHSHVDPWFVNLCMSSKTDTRKWVHTYHTLYFEEDYPEGLTTSQRKINKCLIETASKADAKISISNWLHDYLYETYSIKTSIIPNGVDLEKCDQANSDRFIERYALRDFILFVGSINFIKNSQVFVELAKRMPEFMFIMIGRHLDSVHLTSQYGVSIPKNLIPIGEMSHEDVLDAIAACKVLVMTSKREGIPTVLLEAMGIGRAVVAPNHSGCKEVIQNNNFGFLYNPTSLDELIEKVKQAFISEHIGERAKDRVFKNYSWRSLARRIDSVYESS